MHSPSNNTDNDFFFVVSADLAGRRLDQLIADRDDNGVVLTRSRIQALIRSENVRVNNQSVKKSGYRVRTGDQIIIHLPPPEPSELLPEKVDFDILFEDEDLIVVSKPPGVVVHPAHGHSHGTLVHGLLYHCRNLAGIGGEMRPGIVHRLDKDTSGAMVVAKNDMTHNGLVGQFKARSVEKRYLAVLAGVPQRISGKVVKNIGRHPVHRKKMAILDGGGREAVTGWKVLEEFSSRFSFVSLRLETGRTHQIRVHMASLGCPVAGDTLYGGKKHGSSTLDIDRQCLHSFSLSFDHPKTMERLSFTAPLWPDIEKVLERLRVIGN